MYTVLVVFMVTLVTTHQLESTRSKLTEVFQWKQVDFQFPSDNVRNSLIKSKGFIQANNSMLGLEVWGNKLFITVPRWKTGTGSTLNYVNLDSNSKSPLLIPYPDFSSNDIYNGNLDDKIISTSRIFVDSCNRLWVPDNGQEDILLASPTVLASQKLLIFDLNTNKLLRKIKIGNDVKQQLSLFYEVIVDITNNECHKAYAYIADTVGYGILVYSWETNTFRRITNSYMYFEPQSSVFNKTQLQDGVLGMALSPVNRNGFKTMYFHGLSSYNEYNVSTQVLKDPSLSSDFTQFKLMGNRGEKGQSTNQRLDEKTGVLFYTQVQKSGVGCWNSKRYPSKYSTTTNELVAVDDRLSFPSALTLDSQRNIFVLSNNFLSFADSTFNPNKFNYIVMKASVDKLIKNSVCDV